MEEVVIVSAARTAIGSFGGGLRDISSVELGATVAKAVLTRANIAAEEVEEVIMGNVLSADLGQNPARQVLIKADMPDHIPAFTVNKVCGSGLKSVILGTQAIMVGDVNVVLAGGMENMSRAPYLLNDKSRWGFRMGDQVVEDLLLKDGLTCALKHYHMGVTAENIAERYQVSREDQDTLALHSQQKALSAVQNGAFAAEIAPIVIKTKKGEVHFDKDEYPRILSLEELSKLRPVFKKEGGTVTAGNASGINDGAAAVLLMSAKRAKALGLTPLAKIRAYASSGVNPEIMGMGPVISTQKVLEKARLSIKDIGLIEANEAFAAQYLAVGRELRFDPERVNVNGGAIALGHPIGASGTRILVTLLYAMQAHDVELGLATLCIGGGQGISLIIERKK